MSKLGFMQDLIRGIRKIIDSGSERGRTPQATVVVGAQGTVAPLLERVFMFLEDGAWADADAYCEKVLDLDPKNGRAYLGKLLAELKVANMEQLQGISYREYEHKASYEKAIRFDAGIAKQFAELREKALSAQYDRAAGRQETATSPDDYEGAAAMFAALSDYRDAPARVENCHEQAQALIRQARERERSEAYDRAVRQEAAARNVTDLRHAASMFAALGDYRDSQARAENCNEQAHTQECDAIYGVAQDLMKRAKRASAYLSAAQMFSRIRDWRDAKELEERCRKSAAKCQRKKNWLILIVVVASSLLLATIIAFSVGSCAKSASVPEGYLSYREMDGEVVITGVRFGRSSYVPEDLVIPATLKGKNVTSIGDRAFSGCTSLTSITIPEGVTSIGSCAFSGCTDLTGITIPSSVTSIGASAFFGCTGLTSIMIPSSVTNIGSSAFSGCTNIETATIPTTAIGAIPNNSLKTVIINGGASIGNSAFYGCRSLTSITIPSSVTSIARYAFRDCTSLTSITIPSSVTNISRDAFSGCINIETATIPTTAIGAISNNSLKTVIINGGTSIDARAFYYCTSLTSITIPSSVTRIGDDAFRGCTNLTRITYTGTKTRWFSVKKGSYWSQNTGDFVVHCFNGDIAKDNA